MRKTVSIPGIGIALGLVIGLTAASAQDLTPGPTTLDATLNTSAAHNRPSVAATFDCDTRKDSDSTSRNSATGSLAAVSISSSIPGVTATARQNASTAAFTADAGTITLDSEVSAAAVPTPIPCCREILGIRICEAAVASGAASAKTTCRGELRAITEALPPGNKHTLLFKLEATQAGRAPAVDAILRDANASVRVNLGRLTVPGEQRVAVNGATSLILSFTQTASTASSTPVVSSDRLVYRASVAVVSPFITRVFPAAVPVTGGRVTIEGRRFQPGANLAVSFGGVAGSIVSSNASQIVANVPADLPVGEFVDVLVKHSNGEFTLRDAVEIEAPATVAVFQNINPISGPVAGGTAFTIRGQNFDPADTRVFFGNARATQQSLSTTEFRGATPAGPVGFANIRIVTSVGTRTASRAFYYTGNPEIDSFAPAQGAASGGTEVTIRGRGLKDSTEVRFGGVAATGLRVTADEEIAVQAPRLAGDPSRQVAIEVITAHGRATTVEQFCYVPEDAPSFLNINPASGPAAGGIEFGITGRNFSVCGTEVLFGDAPADGEAVNSTFFEGALPAGQVGFADVTLRTPAGVVVQPGAFYFEGDPVIDGIFPDLASVRGGTRVAIQGRGLRDVESVRLGGLEAVIDASSITDTEIEILTPAQTGELGKVDVDVVTAHGAALVPLGFEFQIFGNFALATGVAKLKKGVWTVTLKKTVFDLGAPYTLNGDEIRIDVEGKQFFRPDRRASKKVVIDKKTGFVKNVSIQDLDKNKIVIDFKKGRVLLTLKLTQAEFQPINGEGVGIGVTVGQLQGVLRTVAEEIKPGLVFALQAATADLAPIPDGE
jgi:hypothetical protein